jgi:hypothetical protein
MHGQDEVNLADALQKDNPRWLDPLSALNSGYDNAHPLTRQVHLFQAIAHGYPSAANLLRQVHPEMFGSAADERRQADQEYESFGSMPEGVANLLVRNGDASYQTEI